MPPDEFAELFDGENHERDAAEVEVFVPTQWCGVEHGLQNRYFGDEHQQHDFGRIAIHLPTAVGGGHVIVAHVMVRFGFVQVRVGAERSPSNQLAQYRIVGGMVHSPVDRDLAFRRVSGAAYLILVVQVPQVFDSHLVAGQRAGFVGADH